MHFDDRLDTVLRQPVSGDAIARIQYVQLLDMLGTLSADAFGASLDPAYKRLFQLSSAISADERADLVRSSGLRVRNARLLSLLAADEPQIASAAIAVADLQENEWLDLIPALPVRSRGILRHRRNLGAKVDSRLEALGIVDRGLPAAAAADSVMVAGADSHAAALEKRPGEDGIGAIVRKIEAYRKEHPAQPGPSMPGSPRLPLGDTQHARRQSPVATFDFATNSEGRIVQADVQAAPMLVGLSLCALKCRTAGRAALSPAIAIRLRQPISRQIVTIDGAPAICGDWQVDATPLFDELTGHFTGHAGRARRLANVSPERDDASHGNDRMRQILHELRNPAGAIQMGSELIQQSISGHVPHEYRALAASIAGDTALVLGGLDELERLVKLDSRAMALDPGITELGDVLERTLAQIHRHTGQKQAGFTFDPPLAKYLVAIDRLEIERLTWRLLAAIVESTGPMEMLDLELRGDPGTARLRISLPADLRDLPDDQLYNAQVKERGRTMSSGMFGLGFTLRLANAEASAAGGALRREDGSMVLCLPRINEASAKISEV